MYIKYKNRVGSKFSDYSRLWASAAFGITNNNIVCRTDLIHKETKAHKASCV